MEDRFWISETHIRCHSGTTKQESIDFCNAHKDKRVAINFEFNIYTGWGDDGEQEYFLDEEGMQNAIELIETHYIHGIKIIE